MKWMSVDNQNLDDLRKTLSVLSILEILSISSASEEADGVNALIEDDFCSSCENDIKNCECGYNDCDEDGDWAYEQWKDSKLEEE